VILLNQIMKKESKINKKYVAVGVVLVALVLYFVFGRSTDTPGLYTVARENISQSAVLSGTVETTDKADLGFAASGRVARISVSNNQQVSQGQTLAQLEIGDLLADLKIKEANYKSSDIDLESAVISKYRTLISDGLALVPESNDYIVEPPTISGIYDGAEGQYKVRIDLVSSGSSDIDLFTFGLEKTKVTVNEVGSTKLGTRGLYISFPISNIGLYAGTVWYLDIPNKSSSSYLSNYNAYIEAKKRLEASYAIGGDNSSAILQAEIQKINAEIRKNTIYAPFSGKVSNIEKEVGESASVGERVVSILGEKSLEVILQVSELDVSRIPENAEIKVTLDAFPGEIFMGTLKTINSRDTEIDGVSVYEAFVEIKPDPRIKTGMRATGNIEIATKENVLAIPNYFIKKIDGKDTVELTSSEGDTRVVEVTLGLLGTNSMVEVLSGLQEGDVISSTIVK
jgi:HlyD family secretion protein